MPVLGTTTQSTNQRRPLEHTPQNGRQDRNPVAGSLFNKKANGTGNELEYQIKLRLLKNIPNLISLYLEAIAFLND